MLHIHVYDACEGRIFKFAALFELVVIKRFEIVLLHKFDNGVGGRVGLHHHESLLVGASGSARHLLQHIEGAFAGAKIGKTDNGVGIQDAHHAHAVEIQPFGHHLCAYQNVGFSRRKFVDNAVVAIFVARGVEVHAKDFFVGKHLFHFIFNSLCAVAHDFQSRESAGGAEGGHALGVAAIVASEGAYVLVIGERHVAIFAFRHPSTLFAAHRWRIPSPILKQYHLLFVC